MSDGFRREGDTVTATFAPAEAEILRNLVAQLVELVRDEFPAAAPADPLEALAELDSPGSAHAPTDPVLARLLPDAYTDPEPAAEFRRYTERGLREAKVANAERVLADLGEQLEPGTTVRVAEADAVAWLRCLTDVRLALATRLGVEQDDDERWDRMPEGDPQRYVHDVYDWLGFVQETLVRAVQ